MNRAQLLGLVRTVLVAVGGWAVGKGFVDNDTVIQIAGALTTILGAVWSVFAPEKRSA